MGVLPTLTGSTGFQGANANPAIPLNFTLAIPAANSAQPGAQPGDLLIASIISWESLAPPNRGLAEVYTFEGAGAWAYGVWAGYWDGDPTPIAWQGTGWNNATGQYFGAFIASFRDTLDSARPAHVTYGPTVAGLPGSGPAVCVNWVRAGFAGVGSLVPFTGTDWYVPGNAVFDASYAKGTIALHADTVADQTSTDASASGSWPYVAFGLDGQSVAPPCRLTGREDSLGVGSGRIWPPPKSQQYSPRRAGGYY